MIRTLSRRNGTTLLLLGPGLLLLMAFVILPVAWITRISLNQNVAAGYMVPGLTFENYLRFLGDVWYLQHVLFFSLWFSLLATAIAIVVAFPLALTIAGSVGRRRQVLVTLTLAPLFIGLVSLVYGWIVIFRSNGLLNALTMSLGLHETPVRYMYSNTGVMILLVYIGIPYIVLTLLDSLGRIDRSLYEAAMNIGARPLTIFRKITLPLSMPGLYAGAMIVFALNFSAFAVPLMVGAPTTNMIGLLVYRQAMEINNLPFAAAVSIVMMVTSIVVLIAFSALLRRVSLSRLGVS